MKWLSRFEVSALVILSLGVGACATDDSPEPAPAAPEAATQPAARLAALTLEGGHQVEFYQLPNGGLSLTESAPLDGQPRWALTDELKNKPLAEVYAALAPAGSEVPAALLAADAQLKALFAAPHDPITAPPSAPPGADAQPAPDGLYTDAQQAWFRSTFCTGSTLKECVQTTGRATSQWWGGRIFTATGYVNSGAASTFQMYYWNGNSATLAFSKDLGSNQVWQNWFYYIPYTYWYATMGNAGATQVSVAVSIDSPQVNSATAQQSGYNKWLTASGSKFFGDSTLQVRACGLDKGCTAPVTATVASDGTFNTTFFLDCSKYPGENTNGYIIAAGAGGASAVGYASPTGWPTYRCVH